MTDVESVPFAVQTGFVNKTLQFILGYHASLLVIILEVENGCLEVGWLKQTDELGYWAYATRNSIIDTRHLVSNVDVWAVHVERMGKYTDFFFVKFIVKARALNVRKIVCENGSSTALIADCVPYIGMYWNLCFIIVKVGWLVRAFVRQTVNIYLVYVF
jgi:hypothetical protein